MFYYQSYASERTRFQGIINDLDRSTGRYRDDISFKVGLSKINFEFTAPTVREYNETT
jgi:hypothetical protein